MSTVKQTQAIPYTGPFNLLYYQLQKLTGVFTEIHFVAFFCKKLFYIKETMYFILIIVSESHVYYMVTFSPKNENVNNDNRVSKYPTSLITYHPKNVSCLCSLHLNLF